jgi:hypothetical protein
LWNTTALLFWPELLQNNNPNNGKGEGDGD